MCVTLTPAASKFMKTMTRLGQAGPVGGFRLSVRPGGCSGYDSAFTIEVAPHDGDTVIEQDGVRLLLDPASCELLRGHTIDFRESRIDGGLSFTRPGTVAACCGSGSGQGRPASATVSFMPRPGTRPAGPDGA